ncbi:hypothetical protein ABW21_db0203069 [Orbilia brochopaga]|nr:hypothetical protein ABW21_db0203069 [Drechslerella brochopaga]
MKALYQPIRSRYSAILEWTMSDSDHQPHCRRREGLSDPLAAAIIAATSQVSISVHTTDTHPASPLLRSPSDDSFKSLKTRSHMPLGKLQTPLPVMLSEASMGQVAQEQGLI